MLNTLFQIEAVGCRMLLIRLMKQVRFLDIFICPERKGSKLPLVGTSAWKLWFAPSWRRCTHSRRPKPFFFFNFLQGQQKNVSRSLMMNEPQFTSNRNSLKEMWYQTHFSNSKLTERSFLLTGQQIKQNLQPRTSTDLAIIVNDFADLYMNNSLCGLQTNTTVDI